VFLDRVAVLVFSC